MPDAARSASGAALGVRAPHRNLLVYWFLQSLLLGPLFPVLLLPRYFKYRSLRYRFGEDGVAAEWGVLFRHEISLGYGRIQDIHLASNLVERWLGLARIQVQTASGSSGAEMTIEGLPDYPEVRDWIYSRMRGAKRRVDAAAAPRGGEGGRAGAAMAAEPSGRANAGWPHGEGRLEVAPRNPDELAGGAPAEPVVAALREVAAELRRVRELLERPPAPGAPTGRTGPAGRDGEPAA